MYWPIGTPQAYGEVEDGGDTTNILSDDGHAAPEKAKASGDEAKDLKSKNILGLRITRSAQFFVTWTAASFTIWQAKVWVVRVGAFATDADALSSRL